jgi:endoglucanase
MFYQKVLSILLLSAFGMPFIPAQGQPVKIASQARLDLSSPSVNLEKGEILQGSGQIQRMNWLRGEAQDRGYTANFAVTRFGWNEIALRFLPSSNGPVELKLMGPWEEASPGNVFRQEILWDALELAGAVLETVLRADGKPPVAAYKKELDFQGVTLGVLGTIKPFPPCCR